MGTEWECDLSRRSFLKFVAAGAIGLAAGELLLFGDDTATPADNALPGKGGGLMLERQRTGSEVWQVSTEEYSQSNIYCEVPYCSADSRYFVCQRVNRSDKMNPIEFMCVELGTWEQRVLCRAWKTSGCAITPDGVFYWIKRTAWSGECALMRAQLPDGKAETIHRFEPANWTWNALKPSPGSIRALMKPI